MTTGLFPGRAALSVVFALVIVISSIAQAPVESAVDAFIKTEMERQKIPGVSLAVVKDGKPLIMKGYGLANIEHQVPVKPETIFQSGSVGKQFTATAVMLLVEDGKIGLDEKIGKYLGEIPDAWANITIRHLLSHTAGMTDYPQDFDFRRDYTEDEILKRAKEIPVAFKPGEKWQYSNLGYVTLGIIIGKVTGKFYGEFLQERIFKPYGMTTARILNEADIVPNRAAGYRLAGSEVKNQEWVSPTINTTADGSLYLTALDMIKWEGALASGGLLKKASLDEMWTPIKLNDGKNHPYGFGWAIRSLDGRRVIEHGGAWQGFRSHIIRYPDNKLTVIVFANLSRANVDRMANRVGVLLDPSLKPKPVVDPKPELSAEFRKLLEEVLSGNIDASRFTPQVVKTLTDPQDRFLAYLKKAGTIKEFKLTETRVTDGGVEGYAYEVEFDSITALFVVERDKTGKIVAFSLRPE